MSSKRRLVLALLVGLAALIVLTLPTAVYLILGDPSVRNPFAEPMHTASCDGDTRAVRAMLQRGADVNAPVWEDVTALHYASSGGYVDTVRVLLAAGADANAPSSHGPVLSWAHSGGKNEAVARHTEKMLLCRSQSSRAHKTQHHPSLVRPVGQRSSASRTRSRSCPAGRF